MTNPTPDKRKYHHGDLAGALIQATLALLREKGPALLSLREVARAAGVSHGAPAHHFGDKAGLLTAVAAQGHKLLARMLNNSQENLTGAEARLLASGEAYVRFAVQQPGYFSIMFQTDLINPQDPDYVAAGSVSRAVLEHSVRGLTTENDVSEQKINATVIALWSQVHGFANLWLAGNFGDPDDAALLDSLLDDMLHSLKL